MESSNQKTKMPDADQHPDLFFRIVQLVSE